MPVTRTDNSDALLRRLSSLDQVYAAEATRALEAARSAAPEASGELRDSGEVVEGADEWEIGFTAPHAPYIELGTAHSDAQPFLLPAAEAMRVSLPDALKRHMEG